MKLGDIIYEEQYPNAHNFIILNGYTIKEIDSDDNGRRFQIIEIEPLTEKEILEQEMIELKNWFNNEYTYKEQKYRRLIALNKMDIVIIDGIKQEVNANNLLMALYGQAETNRLRIQEIEVLLKLNTHKNVK